LQDRRELFKQQLDTKKSSAADSQHRSHAKSLRQLQAKTRAAWFYLGLGIAQAAHSIEEYLTRLQDWFPIVTGRLHDLTGFSPVLYMGERTFVVANMAIITGILALGPFIFQRRSRTLKAAVVISVCEALNGLGHISAAVYTNGYFPGCISAVGLLAFSLLFLGAEL
jgi:hypothetical protein